jgi:hypothetical protein
MLRRWDVRVYDVGFLMAVLDYALDFMDIDSRFDGRFWRSPRLYVKALVLKEVFKASLRYAGNYPSYTSVLEFLNPLLGG